MRLVNEWLKSGKGGCKECLKDKKIKKRSKKDNKIFDTSNSFTGEKDVKSSISSSGVDVSKDSSFKKIIE